MGEKTMKRRRAYSLDCCLRLQFIARLSLFGLWAGPATSAERLAPDTMTYGIEAIEQVTLPLIAVVALLLVLAWVLRRFGPSRGTTGVSLRVLGGLRLGGRERVLLLEVEDRRLLVGVSPAGLRTLLVLDEGKAMDLGTGFEDALAMGQATVARLGGKQ